MEKKKTSNETTKEAKLFIFKILVFVLHSFKVSAVNSWYTDAPPEL